MAEQDPYKDFIAQQEQKENDSKVTSSVNALGSVAATLGIGSLIAQKPKIGIPVTVGTAGAMAGYHGSRMFGGTTPINLIVAGILGAGSAGGAWYKVKDMQ